MSDKLISIKNITLSLESSDLVLLNDCDFTVNKGEVVLILGSNGTGKTTLMETLIGVSPFTLSGDEMYIDPQISTNDYTIDETKIGYARNEIREDLNGYKNKYIIKTLYIKHYGLRNIVCSDDDIKMNLKHLKEAFQYGDKGSKKYLKSSSGERKKTNLIGALSRYNSPLYIFDEPVNCLDIETMRAFRDEVDTLKERGAGVIIVTHCRIFKNVDRVYKIVDKKLVDITDEYKSKSYDCIDL